MARTFPLPRLEAVTSRGRSEARSTPQKVATLVGLTTRLADRMEARPSAGLDRDRDRRDRVALLRRTALAGTRTLEAWDTSGTSAARCPHCGRTG